VIVAGVALKSLPFSSPPAETTIIALLLVQETLPEMLPAELPSVFVPKALSWVEPPRGTVGVEGEIVIEASCCGGKNPRQLTASANVARAARAPANWSFLLVDDIGL
jgi:hypothetical protein